MPKPSWPHLQTADLWHLPRAAAVIADIPQPAHAPADSMAGSGAAVATEAAAAAPLVEKVELRGEGELAKIQALLDEALEAQLQVRGGPTDGARGRPLRAGSPQALTSSRTHPPAGSGRADGRRPRPAARRQRESPLPPLGRGSSCLVEACTLGTSPYQLKPVICICCSMPSISSPSVCLLSLFHRPTSSRTSAKSCLPTRQRPAPRPLPALARCPRCART